MNTGYLSDALPHLYYYRFSFSFFLCLCCEIVSCGAHLKLIVLLVVDDGEWRNTAISFCFRFISISGHRALNAIRNQFTLPLHHWCQSESQRQKSEFFFFFSPAAEWWMINLERDEYLKGMEFIKFLNWYSFPTLNSWNWKRRKKMIKFPFEGITNASSICMLFEKKKTAKKNGKWKGERMKNHSNYA